jgi:hypothetical protein
VLPEPGEQVVAAGGLPVGIREDQAMRVQPAFRLLLLGHLPLPVFLERDHHRQHQRHPPIGMLGLGFTEPTPVQLLTDAQVRLGRPQVENSPP